MVAFHHEAERCVHGQDKRRRTPLLLTGALICYALTGMLALAMLAATATPSPMWTCGVPGPPTNAISCPLC